MSTSEPVEVVELVQPRCVHRFGTGLCTATGTKCYNTISTCTDLVNYDGSGSIKWRFTGDRTDKYDYSDFSDADNPELNAIPCALKVSVAESQINTGSNLDGRSPFGVTAKLNFSTSDFPWDDRHGDFYIADRSWHQAGRPKTSRGGFWALWAARNAFFDNMYLNHYSGTTGQTLAQMRKSVFVMDNMNGPNSSGAVALSGLDPLRLTDEKKAEFPRTSKLELYGAIDASTTTIQVFGLEVDLSDAMGNTGASKYLGISTEIILYTGYTDDGDGIFTLTGVARGALSTATEEHADQDKIQRIGRYENMKSWLVLEDLFKNHTTMDDSFVPISDWNTEGDTYLPTHFMTRTVVDPTPVKKLSGEIMQQSLFSIWWDRFNSEIKLLAVRPPDDAVAVFNESSHLIGATGLTREPESRLSEVTVYYDQVDPFASNSSDNYRRRITSFDQENISSRQTASIYAPWITTRTQALLLSARLLIRYKNVPAFLTVKIAVKDRGTAVLGAVLDIDTETIITTEGEVNSKRWQVISAKEMEAGHSYVLNLQTYEFLGRFGNYPPEDSPDYGDASEAEQASGAFYAADTGLMPDGTEGYKYQ